MTDGAQRRGEVQRGVEEYLDRVEDCVGTIPRFFEDHGSAVQGKRVAEAVSAESDCDAMVSSLRKDITHTEKPEPVGLYIKTEAVLRFLGTTDEVANSAEDAVRLAYVTDTGLPREVGGMLAEMGELAVTATSALSEATLEVFCSLEQPGSVDVSEEVGRVRDAESDCDRLKYDAVEAAFGELPAGEASVAKDIALCLDEVPNNAEDAADVLRYISAG